jgi:hypothetical protein
VAQSREEQPRIAGKTLLRAHAQHPDARCSSDQLRRLAHLVGAHFLESLGQVPEFELQMRADRPPQRHLFRLGDRIVVGLGAIALLAGLQLDLVEVGIAEMLEEARRRRLRHAGHFRNLGSRMGQDVVLPVEHQLGEFLFAAGQPRIPFLNAQDQT